jgi:hypothetical protein
MTFMERLEKMQREQNKAMQGKKKWEINTLTINILC